MKKTLVTILLFFLILFSAGCYIKTDEKFYIDQPTPMVVTVGDKIQLNNIIYDLNDDKLISNDKGVYANKPGEIIVNSDSGKYFIIIKEEAVIINADANLMLSIGEKTKIITSILPSNKNQEVTFESTDSNVITVSLTGQVEAIDFGIARVIIKSKEDENVSKELTFYVADENDKYYEAIINTIVNSTNTNIDLTDKMGVFKPLIEYNSLSIIGVNSYDLYGNKVLDSIYGCGVVYKTNIHYTDGTVKEDVKLLSNEQNIKEFEYYVITNRHLVAKFNTNRVYLGSKIGEIDAELVQYDKKIDLAVIKFRSRYYVPNAKLGSNENLEKGEFILSLGSGTDKDYFRTYTFGVISSPKRYVNTDTDNDGINDWDSEYIQHDASLNEGDSGGAIINMKGEIIGINSTKISSAKYNNVSFAIPINLVMEIVSLLEQGISPERATLGVQILDLVGYNQNPEYYKMLYPDMVVPEGLKYGFYVSVVDAGGVAEKAKVQVGDIIVEFNGTEIKYSYQVRAELGKFLIGSGQIAEIKVIRNGQLVTLYAEF